MSKITNAELEAVFAGACCDVISTIAGISVAPSPVKEEASLENIVSAMCLHGKESGVLFVYADRPTLKVLASCTMGMPEEEVKESDLFDIIAEITNMVAGNAKVRMTDSPYKFTMASPFVIEGKDMRIILKKSVSEIEFAFGDGKIELGMKLIFQ